MKINNPSKNAISKITGNPKTTNEFLAMDEVWLFNKGLIGTIRKQGVTYIAIQTLADTKMSREMQKFLLNLYRTTTRPAIAFKRYSKTHEKIRDLLVKVDPKGVYTMMGAEFVIYYGS